MREHETIADIATWLRYGDKDGVCPWHSHGESCSTCPLGGAGNNCIFDKIADRIDSAAENGGMA